MERFWKWSQLTFRLNKPCLCSLWCIYRQYQQSYFLLRTIFTLCSKKHLVTTNYVFDDNSKTTITQSSLRNELKLTCLKWHLAVERFRKHRVVVAAAAAMWLVLLVHHVTRRHEKHFSHLKLKWATDTHKIAIHRVQKKGATDFFAVTFTNIDSFFYNFSCTTSQENAKVIGVKISCRTLVMLLPYRVKFSDTKVTHYV